MTSKIFTLLILVLLFNCKSDKKENNNSQSKNETTKEIEPDYIEVTTRSMEFICPDTIPSGWNTFKYYNLSNETHFFLMDKYPEGKTIDDTIKEVGPPFADGMALINEGKSEEGFAEFNKLPAWFFEVIFSGGSGLIAPKNTSITTIKLDPGYYIMECYVKMPNGEFHTLMGMAKPIIVTEEDSDNKPPKADIDIVISKEEGIIYSGNLTKGEHIFSVHFKDQSPHEHFIGHDVNLVKLSNDVDLEKLEAWMNWSTPFGLKTPVPNGVTFLGGVNESPAGSTGYFKATLTSGKYAFISEVPKSKEKGMFKTFSITQ
ncbi:hypothetical protein [uncultured Algibacter sp.]|uniref:hypothetical protein n=1 Tax=uncultured Algibacter sp. TaxID=298659 RepID=UPI0026334927|nr:hypothetical protein [uncultured Algibacter sp.]